MTTDDSPIGTLSRGLHLLSCIAKLRAPVRLPALAEASGLNRGTAHRLASKLVELGYLERADGGYRLGVHVVDLGFAYLASLDLRALALPELERLRDELDSPIGLCVLNGIEAVYVESLEGVSWQPSLRMVPGGRLQLHCTAVGKALLAFMPAEQQRKILNKIAYPVYTRHTIGDRGVFEKELQATRKRGYALSDQERFESYRAVAVPNLDNASNAIAAVVAGAVITRFKAMKDLRNIVAPRLLQASASISARMGMSRPSQ